MAINFGNPYTPASIDYGFRGDTAPLADLFGGVRQGMQDARAIQGMMNNRRIASRLADTDISPTITKEVPDIDPFTGQQLKNEDGTPKMKTQVVANPEYEQWLRKAGMEALTTAMRTGDYSAVEQIRKQIDDLSGMTKGLTPNALLEQRNREASAALIPQLDKAINDYYLAEKSGNTEAVTTALQLVSDLNGQYRRYNSSNYAKAFDILTKAKEMGITEAKEKRESDKFEYGKKKDESDILNDITNKLDDIAYKSENAKMSTTIKNFINVANTATDMKNPADVRAIVVAFNKLLEPNSAVLSGDFKSAAGIDEDSKFQNAVQELGRMWGFIKSSVNATKNPTNQDPDDDLGNYIINESDAKKIKDATRRFIASSGEYLSALKSNIQRFVESKKLAYASLNLGDKIQKSAQPYLDQFRVTLTSTKPPKEDVPEPTPEEVKRASSYFGLPQRPEFGKGYSEDRQNAKSHFNALKSMFDQAKSSNDTDLLDAIKSEVKSARSELRERELRFNIYDGNLDKDFELTGAVDEKAIIAKALSPFTTPGKFEGEKRTKGNKVYIWKLDSSVPKVGGRWTVFSSVKKDGGKVGGGGVKKTTESSAGTFNFNKFLNTSGGKQQ